MGSRFKKAYQHVLEKNKTTNDTGTLKELIPQAISIYQEAKPKKRLANIEHITQILSDESYTDEKQLKAALRAYFESEQYRRGLTGQSYLEDCIQAAFFIDDAFQWTYEKQKQNSEVIRQALIKAFISLQAKSILAIDFNIERALSRLMKMDNIRDNDPVRFLIQYTILPQTISEKDKDIINETIVKSLQKLEPYAQYSTKTLDNNLAKMIGYAIQQYLNLNPSEKRQKQSEDLKTILILNQGQSEEKLIDHINDYFSRHFSAFDGSRLKKLILKAIDNHSKNSNPDTRTIQVKTWNRPENSGKKIVLAMHGLRDSVDTFNGIADQYVEAGYTVVSYDQVGHGYDERGNKSRLNLQQMQFDFFQMLEKYVMDETIEDVVVVGHSLGGAVIANSLNKINSLNEKNKGKIKQIQLLAPAAMKNPWLQMIRNLPTIIRGGGDKTESVKVADNAGLQRTGGPSPITALGEFIEFVANAFKSLRRAFLNADLTVPLEIIYAENDGLVCKSNFQALKKLQDTNKDDKKTITGLKRGGHHFFAEGNYHKPVLCVQDDEASLEWGAEL